jgi:hypothetical protein
MITELHDASVFANILPVFGTAEFLKSRSSTFGWLTDGRFVIPYIVDRRLIFRRLIFTTEPIPLAAAEPGGYAAFINDIAAFIGKTMKVDQIAKSQANVVWSSYPVGSEHVEWGSYRLDLGRFDDDHGLMEIIHQKHRNVIRKAVKDGVQVSETSCDAAVHGCLRDTFARQGELLFPSSDYLQRLRENLGPQLLCFKAEHEGKLQGVAVIPFNQIAGYYYYGGSSEKPYAGSLNLMHYEIIKSLKRRGVRMYDFMGARIHVEKDSKFEGIQRFKSRFGGELVQGHTFRLVLKPFNYALFEIAVKAYYRVKGTRYPGEYIDQETRRIQLGSQPAGTKAHAGGSLATPEASDTDA